jgi:WD40 repeat protein
MGNKDKPIWSTTSSENKASTTSLSFSPFNSVLLVTSSVDENLVFYDIQERKPVKKIITE